MQFETIIATIDNAAAWRMIRELFLPGGPVCPRCGASISGSRALAAYDRFAEKTFCSSCSKDFRTRSITPLSGTEWEPAEFVQAIMLAAAGWNNSAIGAQVGKSPRCVRDILERVELFHAVRITSVGTAAVRGVNPLACCLTAQG